eukprot:6180023-Pleurochrysis_carterae.AAC.3
MRTNSEASRDCSPREPSPTPGGIDGADTCARVVVVAAATAAAATVVVVVVAVAAVFVAVAAAAAELGGWVWRMLLVTTENAHSNIHV